MRRQDFPSAAAYYRAHREAFTLALQLDCTPREAEAELQRRQARERWRATKQQLERLQSPPAPIAAELPLDTASRTHVTPEQAFANSERLLGEHDRSTHADN